MRRLPPLNALRAFEAAARHGSFLLASEELRVTPAAISHQVKALEAHLGVALFRRLNRAVRLSDAGRACLPGLRDGFDRLAEAVERATGRDGGGVLTVSVAPSFAAKFLVPRLDRFRALHPNIDVRVSAAMHLVDFAREDVDLGIRYGSGRYPGLHVDPLLRNEVFPTCSPALLRGPKPLRLPHDLRHHTLLHDESSANDLSQPDWSMWLRAAGVPDVDATRGARFSHASLALEAAVAGHGVALAHSVLAAGDLAAGRLIKPFALAVPTEFAYYLVGPKGILESPRARAFRDWILGEVQGSGPAPLREAPAPLSRSRRRRR